MFQSPQWGDNSKEDINILDARVARFSPRNGEIILKKPEYVVTARVPSVSVPAMGR